MADIKTITEAVVIKVQEVFGPILDSADINKDIIFCPDDIALRKRAESTEGFNTMRIEEKEKYRLEFLNVWLTDASFSWQRQRTPLARHGLNVGYVDSSSRNRFLKAVPVDLQYTINLWTNHAQRANDFIKEYCFLQQDNPQLEFLLDGDKPFELDFFIRPNIKAEDKVAKMFEEGKYWKPQITFNVEGWLIKDLVVHTIRIINLDIYAAASEVIDEKTKVLHETITE